MLNWKELGPQSTDRGRRFSGVDWGSRRAVRIQERRRRAL